MSKMNYEPNKFPTSGTELVTAVQTVADATKNIVSGLVFPNQVLGMSVEQGSFTALKNHIRYNTGKPLVQVVVPEKETSFDSLDSLKNVSRNNAKTVYLNGRLILKANVLVVTIPTDITTKITSYNELAIKGNGSEQGLKKTEQAEYDKLKQELTAYFSQAGAYGQEN